MAQWHNETTIHTGLNREYRVYVPESYKVGVPASLIVALHGLNETMEQFSNTIQIDKIADQDNIIVVCPQAIKETSSGLIVWNSGVGLRRGEQLNHDVDDVGFIDALITRISSEYAIDPKKIFAFGFSMGGFMTQRLALELNDRIKVFASVAGTMGNMIFPIPEEQPGRPVSIAHFHGTNDNVVGYSYNAFGNTVEAMLNFWKKNNKSSTELEYQLFPDRVNDGYTVEHYRYTSTFNESVIELFRVNNGRNEWFADEDSRDISFTAEIWKFFKQNYNRLSKETFTAPDTAFVIYPNPVSNDRIYIRRTGNEQHNMDMYNITIYDSSGKKMVSETYSFFSDVVTVPIHNLNKGVCLIEIRNKDNSYRNTKKIIVY